MLLPNHGFGRLVDVRVYRRLIYGAWSGGNGIDDGWKMRCQQIVVGHFELFARLVYKMRFIWIVSEAVWGWWC